MPLNNIEVKYVDIETIKPYKNNAKQHHGEIVEVARQYIKEQGGFEKFAEWGLY